MHRPYISGPMTGYKHLNFPLFFHTDEYLTQLGYDPLNPARSTGDTWETAFEFSRDNPKPWEWYISEDIKTLLQADGIVLLPKWTMSKGACLEVAIAVWIGHEVHSVLIDPNDAAQVMGVEEMHKADAYAKAMCYLAECGLNGVNLKNYVQHAAT